MGLFKSMFSKSEEDESIKIAKEKFAAKEYSNSIGELNKIIETKADCTEAYYYRGAAEFELREFDKAGKDFLS